MKLLLISNKSPWPPRDGGSAATMNMISSLVAAGASVTVLTLNTSKHFIDPRRLPHDLPGKYHFVQADSRITIFGLAANLLFSARPLTIARFESEELKKTLSGILNEKFDIIQIEGLAMTSYLDFIRQTTDTKVVYRPHNVENLIWRKLAREEKNPLKKLYYKNLASRIARAEKGMINKFDALAAMTQPDLSWFKKEKLTIPSLVSPPGLTETGNPARKQIPGSVFFIGALDWIPNIKGLQWFIRNVWPVIENSAPDASFHVAGRNPSQEVRNMCRGRRIVFYGEVESSEMFISDKEVMVVPLFSGSGARIKIIEGMSMGKTIVATTAAAEGMVCRNGEDIFLSDDPGSFAALVTTMLRDANARLTAGIAAKDNVRKNYNILAAAEDLLNFYSRLS